MSTSPTPEPSAASHPPAASGQQLDGPATMPSSATGWWEQERARFVRSRLHALSQPGQVVIDVGCGRADMLDDPSLSDRTRINVDSHRWAEWRGRSDMHFVVARADALPFADGVADVVGSFDVLEHLTDDAAALGEQRRITKRNGTLVAAVPADERLWSAHDDAVGHQRRYSLSTFADLANTVGLTVRRRSYFFAFLWLPAWLARRSPIRTSEPASGDGPAARIARLVIGALAAVERLILRRWSLPFGTSAWFELDSAPQQEP